MTKHGLSLAQRLEMYYIPEPMSGCWLWFGPVAGNRNYPSLLVRGKTRRAHRLMYETHVGSIPPGQEIRHSCDFLSCVNPEHLLPGTHADNMHDASLRKRFPDRRGVKGSRAKLTEADVLAIRADPRGCTTVARKYGVDKTLVWKIRKRMTWTHI